MTDHSMDETRIREELGDLGLSDAEIETYLVVLEAGSCKVSTIPEKSDVSQRYAYNIIESLAERGFVDVRDNVVPTKVRARPPEQTIQNRVARLESLQQSLESRYTETEDEDPSVEIIKSKQTVVDQIESLIASAEDEVLIAVPTRVARNLAPALRAAVDRGVCVVLVETGVPPTLQDEVGELAGAATVMRQWSATTSTIVVVDGTSGLLTERHQLTGAHSDHKAVMLTQTAIVGSFFGSFISGYWTMADEVAVADPEPLPVSFSMARPAIVQATLHLQNGTTPLAVVEGTPTDAESQQTSTISGPVVETRQPLVEPTTSEFPVEASLVLDVDGERVSVGGAGAFVEDYEAEAITLRPPE